MHWSRVDMSKNAVHTPTNPPGVNLAEQYARVQATRKNDPARNYMYDHTIRLTKQQIDLKKETAKQQASFMLSNEDELQFLANIVRSIKGKKTLDIGVYTGYSALSIALALPDDGKVVALDISSEMAEVGRPYWKEAGVEHKIDLRIGDAVETLANLCADEENLGTFDFSFIDADKQNYDNYYEYSLKLLRSGGIIAFDNMFWMDEVLNPEDESEATVALRHLAKKLHKDERVDVSMLSIGDGTYLAFKR